ncbi:MAG: hypothetical protein O3A01_00645 [bacterium]|nr:hypothetical protein [bacterium]
MSHSKTNTVTTGLIKVVQLSDDKQKLPDGSRIVFAESKQQFVLYRQAPTDSAITYVFERDSGKIFVNGSEGGSDDKHRMIELGKYMLSSCKESDLIAISTSNPV